MEGCREGWLGGVDKDEADCRRGVGACPAEVGGGGVDRDRVDVAESRRGEAVMLMAAN